MRQYTMEQKRQALALADRVGLTAASRELVMPEGTISHWQYRARHAKKRGEVWPPQAVDAESDCRSATGTLVEVIAAPVSTAPCVGDGSGEAVVVELAGDVRVTFAALPPAGYLVALLRGRERRR